MGIASDIIEAAYTALGELSLTEANEYFDGEVIPDTIADDSFRAFWNDGDLNGEVGQINNRFEILRNLEILVLKPTYRSGLSENIKDKVKEAHDLEESIIKKFCATRLTSAVRHEEYSGSRVIPVGDDVPQWLLIHVSFKYKYTLNLF